MHPAHKATPYLAQLDGLRAVAIICVLIQHYYSRRLMLGVIGVKLFFVISGFLITGILLKCKHAVDDKAQTRGFALSRFYMRRFLRIMPLFYLVLVLVALLNLPGVRESFFWHATYLSNVYFARMGAWHGVTIPYWSLAVEEQFYLIWPGVILLTPRKQLIPVIAICLLAGATFCVMSPSYGINEVARYALPFPSFMQLGAGALIALLFDDRFGLSRFRLVVKRVSLLAGVPLLALAMIVNFLWWYQETGILLNTGIALVASYLVIGAVAGFDGWRGRLLTSKLLTGMGKISYGIYILHASVREMILHFVPPVNPVLDALLYSFATLMLAAISWYVFESPINRLKRYFDYSQVQEHSSPAVSLELA